MPGPKKTPVVVKLVRGTYRADRDGPRPSPGAEAQINLQPPAWLTQGARESWDYVVANMQPGALQLIDRGILQVFCIAEDLYQQAVRRVNEHGSVVKLDGAPGISPFQRIADRQAAIMLQAGALLGIGPGNRGSAGPSGGQNPFLRNGPNGRPPAA